jgi:hypothetical protein
MHADEARTPLRGDSLGQLVDRDRARVRGEDRAGRSEPIDLAPEDALDLEVLEDRLDDEAGSGSTIRVGRRLDPLQGGVAVLRRELPLRDGSLEVAGDPIAA